MIFDPTPRWLKILNALSQLGNVANPFWDHTKTNENESISGRAHRMGWRLERWIDRVAAWFGDIDHSAQSHQADVARAIQLVESEGYIVTKASQP